MDLEIGAGQGLHAIRYALDNPTRTIIAIERTHEKFDKLRRRQANHAPLDNLVAMHADAMAVTAHFIRDASLDRVFILYPNPYPKNKQGNLRFHNSPFMAFLRTKMRPHSRLVMATNLKWFALEATERMVSSWGFVIEEHRLLDGSHVRARTSSANIWSGARSATI
ncbi:MAG: hypothetical protein HC902_03310 [Calothrix sp. SM1_5_4]|nr:hypothetical protein [Calothrix sp. SM1_5_4]